MQFKVRLEEFCLRCIGYAEKMHYKDKSRYLENYRRDLKNMYF